MGQSTSRPCSPSSDCRFPSPASAAAVPDLEALPPSAVSAAFASLWLALEHRDPQREDKAAFNRWKVVRQATLKAEWEDLTVRTRRALWEEWEVAVEAIEVGRVKDVGELDAYFRLSCPTAQRLYSRSLSTIHHLLKQISAVGGEGVKSWGTKTAYWISIEWHGAEVGAKEGVTGELEAVLREVRADEVKRQVKLCVDYSSWPYLSRLYADHISTESESEADSPLALTSLAAALALDPSLPPSAGPTRPTRPPLRPHPSSAAAYAYGSTSSGSTPILLSPRIPKRALRSDSPSPSPPSAKTDERERRSRSPLASLAEAPVRVALKRQRTLSPPRVSIEVSPAAAAAVFGSLPRNFTSPHRHFTRTPTSQF
ncbi:hypothetical protein JCM8097_006196 [Rhodosporidiobolus ruineniae]